MITPSGVWIVDAKKWEGKVERRWGGRPTQRLPAEEAVHRVLLAEMCSNSCCRAGFANASTNTEIDHPFSDSSAAASDARRLAELVRNSGWDIIRSPSNAN